MGGHTPVTIELRDGDPELRAISHCISILERFAAHDRERMLNYLCERFPKTVITLSKAGEV